MRDSTPLLLQVCAELGLLALRDLFIELWRLAGDREFTAAEVCEHAALPKNWRLRAAIEAVCGELSPRKLGQRLAKWAGTDVAGLRIDCIGDDPAGILWKVSAVEPIPDRTELADSGTIIALPQANRTTRHG